MTWLIDLDARQAFSKAIDAGLHPTAEQQAAYEAAYYSEEGDLPRGLSISGGVATLQVKGVLTNRPSFFSMFISGGNMTYPAIAAALDAAQARAEVKSLVLDIDSPGGQIDGLFDTLAKLQSFSKPITAKVQNLAASAAFAIACQAERIEAGNKATRFGSVGVVASFYVDSDVVNITSTEAPKKRPDVTTEEGKAAVREELDALHDLFVESISEGRGVKVEEVNKKFGQGAVLLAGEALKRGMIDAITEPTGLKLVETKTRPGPKSMNEDEFKAANPEAYKRIVDATLAQERDRVAGHLTMGEASGDMATALEAVKDGSNMTAALSAKYMAAGLNKRDVANRQADEQSVADNNPASADNQTSLEDQVVAAVEQSVGIGA
jgi:ClpP class serine protease